MTFSDAYLVARSSSKSEDNWLSSNAGRFESLLNIDGSDKKAISNAIETVIGSYEESHNGNDQVLIHLFLEFHLSQPRFHSVYQLPLTSQLSFLSHPNN